VTVFVDTAVIMYAAGGEHPLREPCVRILDRVSAGALDAVTSAEVVQEILHRYLSIRQPGTAVRVAVQATDMFAPVLPISHFLMRRVPDLALRYPSLQARDLVHVATCIHEGITEIVSPDAAFDVVHELRRLDPVTFAASLG
jgi:predicted nucleic acid-binding protein